MADEAEITRLQQAVEADPADSETRLALLQMLVEAERWQDAERAGGRPAARKRPRLTPRTPSWASCTARTGAGTPPWGSAGRRSRSSRTTSSCASNLGTPAGAAGRPAGGHRAPREGHRPSSPTGPRRHYALGTALLHRERYREAINSLRRRPRRARRRTRKRSSTAATPTPCAALADNGTMDYYELDCAVQAV